MTATPKRRWYQFSLKMLLVGMTLLSAVMALVYYAFQVPSVFLEGKSGAVCRIYPAWWYDNGATVFCDLAMNGKEVVHGEAISSYGGDFPTARYSLAEIDGGKTVVLFSAEGMSESPFVIFVYKEGSGVVHISVEQEEELVKKYYSHKQE